MGARGVLGALALAVLATAACGSEGASTEGAGTSGPAPATSTDAPRPDPPAAPDTPGETVGTFPKGFLFGSAIAGFQVDMGCPTIAASECEDRASDWYQFITTPRIVDNGLLFMSKDPPSSGPGFYETFEKDLELAGGRGESQLGNGALRLSIEWSRIFPTPTFGVNSYASLKAMASPKGLAFYHRLFAAMKARGMKPFVTVSHYSLPLWIHDGNACNQDLAACIAAGKGGWADPNRARIVNEIAKYAGFLAQEFGAEVDHWATLNEPFSAVVVAGYLVATPMRSNPPGLTGPWMSIDGAKTAATAMVEAHARIYDAIRAFDSKDADGDGKKAEIGLVYVFSDLAPKTSSPEDAAATKDARYFLHDMFMDGVVEGRLDETWTQGATRAPVRPELANRCDFVGVNYYFGFDVAKNALPVPLSAVSPHMTFDMLQPFDENRPSGIHRVLMEVWNKYKKPIYVTETGTTQDDEPRGAAWLVKTLAETRHAIRDGADVRGYFAWSLMDNYEWNHGMHMKFGLYQVDATTKARAMRDAGVVYARMSKEHDVPQDLVDKYASFLK
ncbi:MAG: glycoside hydrolase family 1 protein [Deltaproteobacteria bacterium]|nr:glycoside hydrolase family 1 protein [Deltaproteobacteria bacterium]